MQDLYKNSKLDDQQIRFIRKSLFLLFLLHKMVNCGHPIWIKAKTIYVLGSTELLFTRVSKEQNRCLEFTVKSVRSLSIKGSSTDSIPLGNNLPLLLPFDNKE